MTRIRAFAAAVALLSGLSLPASAQAQLPGLPPLPILGDPQAATTLLTSLIEPNLRLAVPEENIAAVNLLRLLGREREPVTRMRRGPAVEWRPDEVWGAFSLFFG